MKAAKVALPACIMLSASIALSFIHPWGRVNASTTANAPLLEGTPAPTNVRHVLETKCADCHSTNTRWPLYSKLAPGSWLIERDVHEAREHLNLSEWQLYDRETQMDLLSKIASEARSGQMPVKQYLILHPSAKLSPDEQQLLYDWARSERKRLKHEAAAQLDQPAAN